MTATIKSGNTNYYILGNETMESYILVDVGTIQDKNFIDGLKAMGKLPKIGLLTLTRDHYGHVGYVSLLHENFNIPIAMHHKDSDKVSYGSMDFPPAKGFLSDTIHNLTIRDNQAATYPRFKPDIVLSSSFRAGGFPEVEILYLLGYTQDSIGVILEDSLLAGDLVMNMFLPSITWLAEDFSLIGENIHSTYETSFVRIYPGHGSSFSSGSLKKLL